mgnify:CR=1 FL=1
MFSECGSASSELSSSQASRKITPWHPGLNMIKEEIIAERMLLLSPVAMRLEMKQGINNCSIINDSYNSDLGSLQIALDFLNRFQQNNNTGLTNSGLRKTVILSDILQSGRNEDQLYGEVAEMIHSKKVDRLIGIGPAISRHAEIFKTEKVFEILKMDKKRVSREMNYIMLEKIGKAVILPIPMKELEKWIKALQS